LRFRHITNVPSHGFRVAGNGGYKCKIFSFSYRGKPDHLNYQGSIGPEPLEDAPSDPNQRGRRLLELFKSTKDLAHLEEAIQSFRSALVMYSLDHPNRPNTLVAFTLPITGGF
jgi:hypothetical protein